MGKVFIIDLAKCNGCHNCQVACKDEHCDQAWLPYAQAQPETGHFWMKVEQKERGQVPVVKLSYTPLLCNHCDNCALEAKGEETYRRGDGLVIIDPEKAKGKKELVGTCPHGRVFWNDALDLPQKCTGCAHLLDDGWTVPRCVDACPTDALLFGDEEDFAEEIATAQISDADAETGSRVYYLNKPKRFIAGTVVDPAEGEVLIGARVSAYAADGSVAATAATDEFGDFFFNMLEPGVYTVEVEEWGYSKQALSVDVTADDISLGVISMAK